MGWCDKKIGWSGWVVFRGTIPPRAEEFAGLQSHGIEMKRLPDRSNAHWSLALKHPEWGDATLICLRDMPAPPPFLVEHAVALSPEEKERALRGESSVSLTTAGDRGNVLRDRKRLLRFLRAVMADDGLVAMDHLSQLFWSPEALDDELCHDADLDIESLYTLHAISAEDDEEADDEKTRVEWLHSHGLAEIGFLDFDILDPSENLLGNARDHLRAIAFAIVEEHLTLSTPRMMLSRPGGAVRLVGVDVFARRAGRDAAALRPDTDREHDRKRAVLCEPVSFLGRWFGSVEPSRFLSRPIADGCIISFSTEASNLMAERARLTYPQFRALIAEFAEFQFPCLAKLGYMVDGGGPDEREHVWFEVHDAQESRIDATLDSTPFQIERLHQGDRGLHDVELLSDWVVITPAGWITPRNATPARSLRANLDEMRRLMAEARAEGETP